MKNQLLKLLLVFSFLLFGQVNISVAQTFNMCSGIDSTNSVSGTLYDSGGPTGSYSNNEFCTFLINPGCAQSITLTFNAFALESCCDYFRVYDGTSTSGTLLLSANGTSLPAAVTAASGQMFIRFTSDGSVVRSGWDVSWTSQVASIPPVADFSMSSSNPPFGTSVSFQDLTTVFPKTWHWDFGDGDTSNVQNPEHAYNTRGSFNPSLISTNCSSSDTIMKSLSVQNPPSISVDSSQIRTILNCGDSTTTSIKIKNLSGGDLVYQINGSVINTSGSSKNVLAMLLGVDLITEYPNTISAINQYYTNYNLSTINTTDSNLLRNALVGKDILLVPEIESPVSAQYLNFAGVLDRFVRSGGVVIFCGSTSFNNTYQSIFNTGLFSGTIGGQRDGFTLNKALPNHFLLDSVFTTVAGQNATFGYFLSNSNIESVLNVLGEDVVASRDIGNGKAIIMGFDFFSFNNEMARIIANAIKFSHNGSISNWLDVSQQSDTLSAGDSSIVSIKINAKNLFAGNYTDTIVIHSNDSANSQILLPLHLTVNGQPSIAVNPSAINFSNIQVGAIKRDSVTITNAGCDTLIISSLNFTDTDFSTPSTLSQVLPFASVVLPIDFSPNSIKTYADSLIILNNDVTAYVRLDGIGDGAPSISYSPTQINATVTNCGDSTVIPITVYNTGLGTLHTAIDYGASTSSSSSRSFDGFENGNYNNWNPINTTNTYSVITTNPASGTYCLSINGTGSRGLEQKITPDTVDYFSIKMRSDATSGFTNYCLVGDSLRDWAIGYIHHANTNEYHVRGSSVYTHTITNNWTQFEFKNINYTSKTYDVYIDGIMVYASMGFANTSANTMTEINLYNFNSLAGYYDDITIGQNVIVDWATKSSDSINVAINDSTQFDLTLKSAGLNSGTYNTSIVFTSNDPLSVNDTIPVSFNVIGSPSISLSSTACINYGSIVEHFTATDSLYIYNTGCDTLQISNIQSNLPEFVPEITSASIFPNDSLLLRIDFSPTSVGTFNGLITVFNNDVNTTICLNGVSLGAPLMSFNPVPLTGTVRSCDDSTTVPLTIYNTGLSTLNWRLDNSTSINDGFESGIDPAVWTVVGGLASASCGTASGTSALYFNGGLRQATTMGLRTLSGGNVRFYLKFGTGSSPCEDADSGEDVVLEYSINGGSQWVNINTYFTSSYATFTLIQETIPVAAQSNNTMFRWRQLRNSGSCCDHWSIDDVNIDVGGFDAFIADVTPDTGVVVAGDSAVIQVRLSALGLVSGTHNTQLRFTSNDPLHLTDSVPVILTYIGQPLIDVSNSCINFGNKLVGSVTRDSIQVYNTGCDTLTVLNIVAPALQYTVPTTSYSIAPGDSAYVTAVFAPTTVGTFNSFMRIFNNATDSSICLMGTSAPAPIATVNPTSITATVNVCDSTVRTLAVSNTGGSILNYSIDGGVGGTAEVLALTYGVDYFGEYQNTIAAINQYYTNYNLTEINTTSPSSLQTALIGKEVLLIAERESGLLSVFTGFATVLQNFVNAGGTVIFCGSNGSYAQTMFNTGLFSGTYAGTAGTSLNLVNPSHPIAANLVAPYTSQNATFMCNISNTDAIDVVTYSTSSVVSYRNIGSGKAIFIAFDYFNNTNINASRIIANAVEWGAGGSLPSWLSVSKNVDSVAVSGTSNIDVTFNGTGLTSGIYYSNIVINTNDPLSPTITVPCTLNVSFNPCAQFDYTIPNSCNGLVQFGDSSQNTPISWNWNFGDGNSSSLQHPSHTYASAGLYNVRLIVSNSIGNDTSNQNILINVMSATISTASPLVSGSPIRFTSTSVGAISWFWDLGNGVTSNSPTPLTTYNTPGQYIVTLIAINGSGCSAIDTDTINILLTGLQEQDKDGFSIYPNPNKGEFKIINDGSSLMSEVSVINSNGQLIFEQNENLSQKVLDIDVGDRASGIYYVKILFKDGRLVRKKLVIE